MQSKNVGYVNVERGYLKHKEGLVYVLSLFYLPQVWT